MKSIDLNICQRGLKGTNWTAESGVITKENLNKVVDQRTDNTSSQNALPTPFARFFLMDEAFRLVTNEKKDGTDAGKSYKRMVSDCLDVFELLYNWLYNENHWKQEDYKLEFRVWTEEDLVQLKQRVPLLGLPLDDYYTDDISNERRLIFLVLKNKDKEFLLACSSPKTGWVTPPDLDKYGQSDTSLKVKFVGERYNSMYFPAIKRAGGQRGAYFRDCRMFEERSAGFKNYMLHKIVGSTACPKSFDSLRNYIFSFRDNDDDIKSGSSYSFRGKPISLGNGEKLNLYGLPITCNDGMDATNFFSENIIKIPYGISSENFTTFLREEDSAIGDDHDYLLPLTAEALEVLRPEDIHLSIQENSRGDRVTVSLIHQGETFKHIYATEPRMGEGYLLDTEQMKIRFDMALFPNILSPEITDNNYFKVALIVQEGNKRKTFDISKTHCSFYKAGDEGFEHIFEADDKVADYGVHASAVRSVQSEQSVYSSKYFEVFSTTFDAIMLSLCFDEQTFSGVLLPRFKSAVKTDKCYTYAIDFGTTNTYVSRREAGEANVPEQLKMANAMTSYLHKKDESAQKSAVNRWETMPFVEAEQALQTEFLPAFIDGAKYKFPLRTAMTQRRQAVDVLNLFGNTNIAFAYEKSVTAGDNFVRTNIKWDGNNDDDRLFVRELLMIIRADVLQSGGDLKRTNIVWFRPLSFKPQQKESYMHFWIEESRRVLGITPDQVKCYTESEAPYYYYHEKRTFEENRSVLVLDIGGGSTDMVHFSGNKLTMANSVHFGCDVMWSGGFNRMANDHAANGVFCHCKDKVTFKDETLKLINDKMCQAGSRYATTDIINFWISNDDESHVTQQFRAFFKPVFLYHYSSIIFYVAQVLKSKGLECPTAITYSGNGSRYIDEYLTSNKTLLQDITRMVMESVLGKANDSIQLVMPDERKESTCYGGLYHDGKSPSPEPYFFIGTENKEYNDVEAIKRDYEEGTLKKGLLEWMGQVDDLFLQALDMLVQREQLSDIDKKRIAAIVRQPISLDTIMRNEVFDNPLYNDSLFFLPVTARIEKLTHLNETSKKPS